MSSANSIVNIPEGLYIDPEVASPYTRPAIESTVENGPDFAKQLPPFIRDVRAKNYTEGVDRKIHDVTALRTYQFRPDLMPSANIASQPRQVTPPQLIDLPSPVYPVDSRYQR